jgi:hypothetical protein
MDRLDNRIRYNLCDNTMDKRVKRIVRRKKLELLTALLGYLIGIGLGLWAMVKMVMLGISK